jgi:hypothetical protein
VPADRPFNGEVGCANNHSRIVRSSGKSGASTPSSAIAAVNDHRGQAFALADPAAAVTRRAVMLVWRRDAVIN